MKQNLGQKSLSSNPKIDFAIGGQAVLEGVMMRSPDKVVIATRAPRGEIQVKVEPYISLIFRHKWLNIPVLRGMVNLVEMMTIGTRAINHSASVQFDEDSSVGNSFLQNIYYTLSFICALLFSLFLFKLLPLGIASFAENFLSALKNNYLYFNAIDGLAKLLIFVGYIGILSFFSDFRRIFQYHGAEHKVIMAYEKNLELTPENCSLMTRFHPRCGTSFILIVFIFSVLLYTLFPRLESFGANLLLRVALLPLIAGLSYEFLKLSAKYSQIFWAKILVLPGLWLQRLTTKEPDLAQLEVSIRALKEALKEE